MKKLFCLFLYSTISLSAFAQSVTISPTNTTSGIIDVRSTDKGFLPPRMTTASRLAISSPTEGLMVFDTDTDSYQVFANNKWTQLTFQGNSVYTQPTDRYDRTGSAGDLFGSAVSLGGSNGTFALIGAPFDNSGKGACYISRFVLNNIWSLSSIGQNNAVAGDNYGRSVAVDRINNSSLYIVGAPLDDSTTTTNSGSAYVYHDLGSNSLRAKLFGGNAAGIASHAHFGRSVDIAGSSTTSSTGKGFAVVGASGINSGRGGAYVYKFNPNTLRWDFDAALVDAAGAAGDSMGLAVSIYYDVDIDEAWIFVGAPYDDENGFTNVGSVLVYRKPIGNSVWSQVAKIGPTGGLDGALFGYAIGNCFECQKVIVGTPGNTTLGRSFDFTLSSIAGNTATFTATQIPNSSNSAGVGGILGLGSTLSVMKAGNCDNIFLLLGSNSGLIGNSSGNNFGHARLLKYNGTSWINHIPSITDPNPNNQGYGYGKAVTIHTGSKNIIIGAPNEPINGNSNQGKVQFVKFEY